MYIPENKDIEARKNCMALFRDFGVKSLNEIQPHKLTWAELNLNEKRSAQAARSLLDKAGSAVDDDELKSSLNAAHDALMALYDAFQIEKDVRSDIGSKEARFEAETPAQRAKRPAFSGIVGTGNNEEPAVESYALKRSQPMVTWARAKSSENVYDGLSVGKYLRSMIVGADSDIERRALAEGTDSAGGYTTPLTIGAKLIDLARSQSVLSQAGAQIVPLTSKSHSIARLASDPVPTWRGENAAVTESDPTFDNVPLVPKSLAVLVKVSRELLEDTLNLEAELPRILGAALAKELDRAGLLGNGSSNEPLGIANMAGIGTSAHDAALLNYSKLVTSRTGILTANTGPVSAYIMHPRDEGTLTGLTDTNGQPLMAPQAVADIPTLTTTAIPVDGGVGSNESTIFAGNFNHLLIGMRSEIQVEVLKETFMGNLQYGLVAHLRADFAAQHAGAFYTVTGVQG